MNTYMNTTMNTLDDIILPAFATAIAAIAIAASAASWNSTPLAQATEIAQAPVVQLERVVITARRDTPSQTRLV